MISNSFPTGAKLVKHTNKGCLNDSGMSWDFFVPVCVGDLVKTGGINQYVVQDVVSAKQLPSCLNSKLSTCRQVTDSFWGFFVLWGVIYLFYFF